MDIIPPPSPTRSRSQTSDGVPIFDVEELTDFQVAAMAMMQVTEIIDREEKMRFIVPDPPSRDQDVPKITGTHILRYQCPVVMHLRRRRMIEPNGDIITMANGE